MIKQPRFAGIFASAIAMVLIFGTVGGAVNNRQDRDNINESLGAALSVIGEKKAHLRMQKSQDLAKEMTPLEKDWGIKLHGIRQTAGGYMLEMKFRVIQQEKAFPLLKRHIKRYLVVEKNGSVLEVPFTQKLGSLRSTVRTSNMVKEDHNYVALFANPGKHVKPGDRVTLVIGNFIAENLTVR